MKFKAFLSVIVLSLLALSCGYHLRGTGSFLPSYIKNIYIPEFENTTSRMDLGRIVTEEVISAFISRGNFKLVKNEGEADAELKGKILNFNVIPINVDAVEGARYKVRVTVKVELIDLKGGKVLYKNPSFYYEDEYDTIEGGDFLSMETSSIQKIAEEMATTLINTIMEGF